MDRPGITSRTQANTLKFMGILGSLWLAGCGQFGAGSPAAPNDPAPNLKIVAQGPFTSLNGKTVSGNVIIYNAGTKLFVMRLSGLTAPSGETGMVIVPIVDGVSQGTVALQASSGNQNYNVNLSASSTVTAGTWNQVNIRQPSANLDYGQALMTQQP